MKKTFNLLLLFSLLLPDMVWSQSCQPMFDYYKRGKDVAFYVTSRFPVDPFYVWNFGDGSFEYSIDDYIVKSYKDTGTYTVCLKDSFCTTNNLFCDSIKISNSIPVYADFSYTLESTGKITLYNEASSSSPIMQYYWELGDGLALEGENDSLVYQYKASGTYQVCMYAFDQQKNYNYQCSSVVVIAPEPCYAAFTKAFANGEYYFLNQSVFSGDSASWLWNFGDSTTSTERDPKHTYTAAGNYRVTLQMNYPCNSTYSFPIYFPGPGLCDLNVSATLINQKAIISISDTLNFPTVYNIEFGDGQSLTTADKNIEHLYNDTGNYVIVVQSDFPMCGEVFGLTYARVNSLEPICRSSFYAYPGDTGGNKVFVVSNSQIAANGNNKSYIKILWGDGSSEIDSLNQIYYQHAYDSAGIYTIRMIVSNQVNCADTSFKSVGVGPVYKVTGTVKQGSLGAAYNYVNAFMFEPQSGLLSYGISTFTNDTGYYELYLRKGYYIIQTDFSFDPSLQEFYLPTYYGDKLNWTGSDVLTILGNRSGLNINQIPFNPINRNGGKIAGTATFGKNVKLDGQTIPEGKPAEKMLIFLLDGSGKPVAFTHTDPSGKFGFDNIGAGNFTVWAEMPGKMTIPPYVSLANNTSTAENIKIIIGQNSVTSLFDNRPITENLNFEMYPNPTTGDVNIKLINAASDIASVEVYDLLGKQSEATVSIDKNAASINVSSLQNGLYFITVIDKNGASISKKLLKY